MALSSSRTPSLETLDSWRPDPDQDPAGHPPSETRESFLPRWGQGAEGGRAAMETALRSDTVAVRGKGRARHRGPPAPQKLALSLLPVRVPRPVSLHGFRGLVAAPVLDLEAEPGGDVILVGSSELSSPPSPGQGRDLIAYEVRVNQRSIEDICLCCGSFQVHTQHPLFEGGMCAPCKDKFLDTLFLYDDDGYQSYCSICCSGETLLICENPDCTRCYCFECVDSLVCPGTSEKVHAMSNWVCFLCLPFSRSGLLQRRRKWRAGLKAFCDRESESPLEMYQTVPVWKREPVRVLSLFGDIKRELTSLGFLENGSGPGRLKHLDDVTDVVRRDVEEWGPFDLLYGATPPLGDPCCHPPGWYLFQFCRLLQYARPLLGSPRPFFWMFVDNLVLTQEDVAAAVRFLEMEPVTIQDVCGRALQDAARVWSNIPAVRSKHSGPVSEEELSLLAQDRQRARLPRRTPAQLVKNCFLPLREYFKYFSPELTSSL
ncbi:DNA (cytosine-5)-methyltransferase 3-like [Eulemur rufifrons]|uniref:DNA (cytosine-5)-methyltransferase 3-like n=1 Tax=Eulemur rufifrons TaxID=859984 RepID=UPI0037432D51